MTTQDRTNATAFLCAVALLLLAFPAMFAAALLGSIIGTLAAAVVFVAAAFVAARLEA